MSTERININDFKGILKDSEGKLTIQLGDLTELIRTQKHLRLLMDSARSIMNEMELDNLLVLIMDKVTEVMDADRSTLFIVADNRQELWSRVAQGTDEIRIPYGHGIAGFVAESGRTLNIEDAYEDPRFEKEFDLKTGYRTKSILCMPVFTPQGEITGVIQVLNKKGGEQFLKTDEELLSAFSSLAGISISNSKVYEQLQKERDNLDVRVKERTNELEQSRQKSDELLRNILPAEVADELKSRGQAGTRQYKQVTVMFTDFKGFTNVSQKLPPAELLKELDRCFYYFDEVVERYNLEKIKTIGDSYMCAGGIPVENRTNAVDAVLAAIEIQKFMQQMKEIKESVGQPYWELRLGIHTGPVIAGVVGKQKFAYDIWGETVNTASHMESTGESGQINISKATYELVKDFFTCDFRGRIPLKHMGEAEMFFVTGIRKELSREGRGEVPNENFFKKLNEN